MEQLRIDVETGETRAQRQKPPKTDYEAFVEKFKPQKTTDDCYTPSVVYDAIAEWVAREWGLDRNTFLRPFRPGGDYEREEYPPGCAVVDNPPFSILQRIVDFYCNREIPFFLFAPTLTLFSGKRLGVCYMPTGVQVTYENGAKVNTSFVTNMERRYVLRTALDLRRAVKAADERNRAGQVKELSRYTYPPEVLTAAAAYQISKAGVDYRLRREDMTFIGKLDAMRKCGKGVFGGGYAIERKSRRRTSCGDRAWPIRAGWRDRVEPVREGAGDPEEARRPAKR